jgi:hypothetical protein
MAARKGTTGFTRGGMPVNAHPTGGGAKGPRRRKSATGGTTNYAEPVAWGLAAGLTAGAGALIGAGIAGMRNRKTR